MEFVELKKGTKQPLKRHTFYKSLDELEDGAIVLDNEVGVLFVDFDNLDENKGAVWGKIDNNIAVVNKNVLTEAMNRQGYDFSACSRKWQDKGRLKLNSQGYITHQTKVCGIKANYIKLILPEDEPEFEEVTSKDNPFTQEQLPFD